MLWFAHLVDLGSTHLWYRWNFFLFDRSEVPCYKHLIKVVIAGYENLHFVCFVAGHSYFFYYILTHFEMGFSQLEIRRLLTWWIWGPLIFNITELYFF